MKRRIALRSAFALMLTGLLYWAMLVVPVLPFGSLFLTPPFIVLGMFSLVALGGVALGAFAFVTKQDLHLPLEAFCVSVAVIIGTVGGTWLGQTHRNQRLWTVVNEASALILSIERFEQAEQRPPHELSELVPRYLAAIPSPQMGGYPEWRYIAGGDAYRYEGNRWVIIIHTTVGGGFDQLMYFPNQRYPEYGYGGRLERIGAWAYVHE